MVRLGHRAQGRAVHEQAPAAKIYESRARAGFARADGGRILSRQGKSTRIGARQGPSPARLACARLGPCSRRLSIIMTCERCASSRQKEARAGREQPCWRRRREQPCWPPLPPDRALSATCSRLPGLPTRPSCTVKIFSNGWEESRLSSAEIPPAGPPDTPRGAGVRKGRQRGRRRLHGPRPGTGIFPAPALPDGHAGRRA